MLRSYVNTPNVWPFVDKVYWKHSAGGNLSIEPHLTPMERAGITDSTVLW